MIDFEKRLAEEVLRYPKLEKKVRGCLDNQADVVAAIKETWRGTGGYSTNDVFVDYSPKGFRIWYSFDDEATGERKVNERKYTFSEAAKIVIEAIKERDAEDGTGEAKARSDAGEAESEEGKTVIELVKNEDVREVSGKGLAGGDGAMAVGYAAGFAEGEALVTVSRFEMQIAFYKEQALTGYIGIGRVLNEAKASGAIPHGAWEDWVVNVTGMQLRHAQRCMKAASEIRDGSFIGQLDMSKAMLLLSSGLEEEEKERLGKKASEEGATVKQLREEIKQLKLEKVRNSGAVSEAKIAIEKAKAEKAQAENQLKAVYAGMQERLDEETKRAYQRGVQDESSKRENAASRQEQLEKEKAELEEQIRKAQEQIRTQENLLKDVEKQSERAIARELDEHEKRHQADLEQMAAEIRKEYEGKISYLNMKAGEKAELLKAAEERIAEAERKQSGKWDEGYQAGLNQAAEMAKEASGARAQEVDSLAETLEAERKEWEKRLAEMRDELRAAEEREEKKAAELSRLKKEKAQASMDAARGIGAQAVGAMDLAGAVRDFIGRAGSLPQMESMIAEMNDRDREAIRVQVETVGRWVDGALAALGVVRGSGYVL